ILSHILFLFQAEDGIRDRNVTGVQTCALPICRSPRATSSRPRPASSPSPPGPATSPARPPPPTRKRGTESATHPGRTPDTSPAGAAMRDVLRRLAPGTPLREALDRMRRSGSGGLIVLGHDPAVRAICDGGVDLDVEFGPALLRELSKMDGAVVLSTDGTRIRRANVHLVPDPSHPAAETGTRHRAAERTSLHAGVPTVAVSASMTTVTVYCAGLSRVLVDPVVLLARADQSLSTLERQGARTARARAHLDRAE